MKRRFLRAALSLFGGLALFNGGRHLVVQRAPVDCSVAGATPDSDSATGIDAVITWVNGSDPDFQDLLAKHKPAPFGQLGEVRFVHGEPVVVSKFALQGQLHGIIISDAAAARRFNDYDSLKYLLRSLDLYAPWLRRVYLVTNTVPRWINDTHSRLAGTNDEANLNNKTRLRIISHKEIFGLGNASKDLPTFSSHAIELHLHRIPGLSKRFIYFNDDELLLAPLDPSYFINTTTNALKFHLEPEAVGPCFPKCEMRMLANGVCDAACNEPACAFDGGDCREGGTFGVIGEIPETWIPSTRRTYSELRRAFPKDVEINDRTFGHVPIMYDKDVLEALWKKLPALAKRTSREKFRVPDALLIAFGHASLLMAEEALGRKTGTISESTPSGYQIEPHCPSHEVFTTVTADTAKLNKTLQNVLDLKEAGKARFLCVNDDTIAVDHMVAVRPVLKDFFEKLGLPPSSFEIVEEAS